MKSVFIIILALSVSYVDAQTKWSKKAQQSFAHKKYFETIGFIDKIPKYQLTINEKLMVAESYRKIHDYEMALLNYEALNNEGLVRDSSYLFFAQVLESNGQYSRASKYFKIYNEAHPNDEISKRHIHNYKEINGHLKNEDISFKSFGLNTNENDFVGFFKEGNLIMVSGGKSNSHKVYKWDDQHFLNYYTCIKRDSKWEAHPIESELRSNLHEGPGYFDSISNTLYFTKNSPLHVSNTDFEVLSNLKIYSSEFNGQKWLKVQELPFNDTQYSTGHPAGLPGKSVFIFSSNKPGGSGEADLYLIHKINSGWSEPKRLEGAINTQGQEVFPFLLNDSTLYFASNGHNGFGGLDLFKAKLTNGKATNIQNMGQGFNTPHDDFGIVFTDSKKNQGYFSSDRLEGNGGSDIYTFEESQFPIIIKVINESGQRMTQVSGSIISVEDTINFTTDQKGVSSFDLSNTKDVYIETYTDGYEPFYEKMNVASKIDTLVITLSFLANHIEISGLILDENNNEPISDVRLELNVDSISYLDTTNNAGEFSFVLPKKEEYNITIYKEGYLTSTVSSSSKKKSIIINKPLTAIDEGMLLNISNIYYEYNEDYITTQAEPILDSLANIMKMNPKIEIEVSSHTDSRGSIAHNEDLSLRRAKSVIDYLKTKNINSSRLSLRYYGESQLLNNCGDGKNCGEILHSSNRRTEFRIIRF